MKRPTLKVTACGFCTQPKHAARCSATYQSPQPLQNLPITRLGQYYPPQPSPSPRWRRLSLFRQATTLHAAYTYEPPATCNQPITSWRPSVHRWFCNDYQLQILYCIKQHERLSAPPQVFLLNDQCFKCNPPYFMAALEDHITRYSAHKQNTWQYKAQL